MYFFKSESRSGFYKRHQWRIRVEWGDQRRKNSFIFFFVNFFVRFCGVLPPMGGLPPFPRNFSTIHAHRNVFKFYVLWKDKEVIFVGLNLISLSSTLNNLYTPNLFSNKHNLHLAGIISRSYSHMQKIVQFSLIKTKGGDGSLKFTFTGGRVMKRVRKMNKMRKI